MVTAFSNRNHSSSALLVISTGFFLLAVLFSLIGRDGFYVSLALLVLGCFSMIAVGILHESHSKSAAIAQSSLIAEAEDF